MRKKPREYVDKDHEVMDAYYGLLETYDGRYNRAAKAQLEKLMKQDPDFLDPYLLLFEILQKEGKLSKAEKVLDQAYIRALRLITDKQGNWPDILRWGYLENRHIIRTIVNKAVYLWACGEAQLALELFRKLLKTNPNDNPGVRYCILAIRMNMSFAEHEKRFNKGGYYDQQLDEWFSENYEKFPDEFGWWDKAMEEQD